MGQERGVKEERESGARVRSGAIESGERLRGQSWVCVCEREREERDFYTKKTSYSLHWLQDINVSIIMNISLDT